MYSRRSELGWTVEASSVDGYSIDQHEKAHSILLHLPVEDMCEYP